ncbi:MAG: outer membrane beta-barrel protein [Gammaproteobacteria bacterium]|nr:outer membrane beta-barrel protein [Gammaproteobacteria bacterium]
MLKKIILTSAVCLFSNYALASPPAAYIGGSIGINVNTNGSNGSFRGLPLTISAGYGGMINPSLYLAGEVYGVLVTASLNDNGNLKSTYGYGISFIPGLALSDHAMAFLRAGAVKSRFTRMSSTKTGGEVGVGLQASLTQYMDLRSEYDFIKYKGSLYADQFNFGLVYKFL